VGRREDREAKGTPVEHPCTIYRGYRAGLGNPVQQLYYSLGAGSGSNSEQTVKIMVEFVRVCSEERTELMVVVGDVNSTMEGVRVGGCPTLGW